MKLILTFLNLLGITFGILFLFPSYPFAETQGKNWCREAGAIINANEQVKCQFQYAKKYSFRLDQTPYIGNQTSGIEIVTFSDLNCEACADFEWVIQQLLDHYKDSIRFYWKHFPIDRECNPHTRFTESYQACLAHQAAYAAQSLGVFWIYVENLYSHFGEYSADQLIEYAVELGLDREAFEQMMKSSEAKEQVSRDIEEGWNLGLINNQRVVSGTPTLFINGALIRFQPTFESLKKVIDNLKITSS